MGRYLRVYLLGSSGVVIVDPYSGSIGGLVVFQVEVVPRLNVSDVVCSWLYWGAHGVRCERCVDC
jgi:hypothetical protein